MTTEATEFSLGMEITSAAQLAALPVGTQIEHQNLTGERYTKIEGGDWERWDSDRTYGSRSSHFDLTGANHVTHLPTAGPAPGDWFTWGARVAWYRIATIDEEFVYHDGYFYVPDGHFTEATGHYPRSDYDFDFYRDGDTGLPTLLQQWLDEEREREEQMPVAEVTEPLSYSTSEQYVPTIFDRDTLARFKRRVAAVTLGAGQLHNVNRAGVERALGAAGVEPAGINVVEPGNFVEYGNAHLLSQVNDAVYVGLWDTLSYNPGSVDTPGRTLLRTRYAPGSIVAWEILSVGDQTLSLEDVTYGELIAIDAFRTELRRAGDAAQGPESWCGVYHNVVASLRCEPTTTRAPRGTAEEVSQSPAGTVWMTLGERPIVVVRDDRADNPARTRRIGGGQGHWAPLMFRIADNTYRPDVPWYHACRLPVGSQVTKHGNDFERLPDGWHYIEGGQAWSGTGAGDFVQVVRFGGEES